MFNDTPNFDIEDFIYLYYLFVKYIKVNLFTYIHTFKI